MGTLNTTPLAKKATLQQVTIQAVWLRYNHRNAAFCSLVIGNTEQTQSTVYSVQIKIKKLVVVSVDNFLNNFRILKKSIGFGIFVIDPSTPLDIYKISTNLVVNCRRPSQFILVNGALWQELMEAIHQIILIIIYIFSSK